MKTNSKEVLEFLEKIKNSKEPRRLSKIGEWLKSNPEPLTDYSKLTPAQYKSLMRAVLK